MAGVRFMRHRRWADALFVHFPVDSAKLAALLPPDLDVDEHEGTAYVGIVALTEEDIVPFPPGIPLWLVRWMGLSHHAVNVRTYVRPKGGGPAGIYFFSLDCSALLPTLGARALFNLPYRYSWFQRSEAVFTHDGRPAKRLESRSIASKTAFSATWAAATDGGGADPLGAFFVERYALYNEGGWSLLGMWRWATSRGRLASSRTWSGTITHEPWPLRRATLDTWHSSVLEAVGLDRIVRTRSPRSSNDDNPAGVEQHEDVIVHCSSGVGPIEFFLACAPEEHEKSV